MLLADTGNKEDRERWEMEKELNQYSSEQMEFQTTAGSPAAHLMPSEVFLGRGKHQ